MLSVLGDATINRPSRLQQIHQFIERTLYHTEIPCLELWVIVSHHYANRNHPSERAGWGGLSVLFRIYKPVPATANASNTTDHILPRVSLCGSPYCLSGRLLVVAGKGRGNC